MGQLYAGVEQGAQMSVIPKPPPLPAHPPQTRQASAAAGMSFPQRAGGMMREAARVTVVPQRPKHEERHTAIAFFLRYRKGASKETRLS